MPPSKRIFTPGIYEHAAAVLGVSPWEISRSGARLADAHHAAWERYQHPIIVVGTDIYNLEPEAYGAVVSAAPGNGVPAITAHPFAEIGDLAALPILEPLRHARIREVLEAGKALKKRCPGAEVRVPVCGPIAFAAGLIDLENVLIGLAEDEELTGQVLMHLVSVLTRYMEAIAESGLLPMIFESGSTPPLLPVDSFRRVEAPALAALFDNAAQLFGERPPCIIGGDAAPIAEFLFSAGPGYVIAPSETDQEAFLRKAAKFPEVHVRVNMSSTMLVTGNFAHLRAEVNRCVKLALSRPNTSIGCGVVPYETDPEALLALQECIAEESLAQQVSWLTSAGD